MKLLLDEMWSPAVARQLRARGHDVVAVAERHALRTKSDAVILAASLEENRIVVTEDADDYRDLALAEAREGRGYPAFIVTSNNRWPRGNPRTLGRLVRALDTLLNSGRTIEGEHWLTPVD